jgi:hypothetical protein
MINSCPRPRTGRRSQGLLFVEAQINGELSPMVSHMVEYAIPNRRDTSARKPASSPCCILGVRSSGSIPMSIAASCCTCFRKVLCAFGTSDSWPTGDAPRSCHFAFICLAQRRKQSKTYQAAKTQVTFGSVQMRWTDEGHRKTHCCRDPTSFSSRPGHCCRMKRLSTTRNFCVRQHPQSLCALPFYKPRLSTFSSLLFARVIRLRHLFISRCRLSCSAAQPRRISTPVPRQNSKCA